MGSDTMLYLIVSTMIIIGLCDVVLLLVEYLGDKWERR